MRRSWLLIAVVLCAACSAPDPNSVLLVERAADVPAHAAPGENDVAFRFASGSRATILATDPDTGWLQIRGTAVGGAEAIGWITERYVRERPGGGENAGGAEPEPAEFDDWCPPKGSPDPRPDGRLRLATWNIANLNAEDGRRTFAGDHPSEARFPEDYDRIRCYVRLIDPDVLAVQEVDGPEALARVVDTDVYAVHVSERPRPGDMQGRQNTGFAYKRGLDVRTRPDYEALDTARGELRYGARIDVVAAGTTLQLMSIHLKSGCFGNDGSGPDCVTLFAQVPRLERWIDEQAAGPDPFVVLGDFNRNLDAPGDAVWSEIDDAHPADADLTAITEGMTPHCRDQRFPHFIDHIVFDRRSIRFVDRSTARQVDYEQTAPRFWDKISDHCPIVVDLDMTRR